ncbi:hypothetical protein [Primorskyibacter sp. S187A]|uniref:hypothetical protein n=1 Tax=Primorskyibacter sp. S187A TaxID=3415130 RepID=UPI003C7AC7EE
MSNQTKTLLLIAAFVVAMVASFVWFVATWDPSKEEPVTMRPMTVTTGAAA